MSVFGGALKRLYQGQLSASLTTLYTAPSQPSNAQTNLYTIWICNTDSSSRTFTLRCGGGTTANSLYESATLAANTTIQANANTCLAVVPAGTTVQGSASVANVVTVSIYGEEITSQ